MEWKVDTHILELLSPSSSESNTGEFFTQKLNILLLLPWHLEALVIEIICLCHSQKLRLLQGCFQLVNIRVATLYSSASPFLIGWVWGCVLGCSDCCNKNIIDWVACTANIYFSLFWRMGSRRSRQLQIQCLMRTNFLVHRLLSSHCYFHFSHALS